MGIAAGLIAGIVASIIFIFSTKIAVSMGFYEPHWHVIIPNAYGVNILLGIIWGAICGIIFSRVYGLIPGKAMLKGFSFGLLLFIITPFRQATWWMAYGYFLDVTGNIFSGFFKWIIYGLILGILYEFLRNRYYPIGKVPKITKHDMSSGFLPGAFAGFLGGMAASFAVIIAFIIGIFKMPGAPTALTFEFWISQAGTHIFINVAWGIVFGAIYARIYNSVPGMGVSKGIIYGLTVFLIDGFQIATYYMGWGLSSSAEFAIFTASFIFFVGFFAWIVFGLVLGYLYRK